ncbi:alpha-tocopherol transfer protein-like [Lineus longissimus]|uniref:alpha-tocopherol transfer protein-like n=1 Tax=Lineus longissimus TaxID=88925 RepID=UPI002B4E49BD
MSTDFTGEGTYECQLDDAAKKTAKSQLNENPKERASQIEKLRTWLKQQPHLTCRTDDHFLLRFLRRAKFSQLLAQELIENFVKIRCSPSYGVTDWFKGNNVNNAELMRMLELGTNIPLPGRDDKDRKVILIRTAGASPEDFELTMRMGFMVIDLLLRDELNQIHGFVVFLDFTHFTKEHAGKWGVGTIKKAMKCWQDTYPIRNKGINYYNTPTLFNAIFDIFKMFMKQKLRDRIHFHKGDLKSLHKEIPKAILPEEYGGKAGPLQKIIDDWKDYVMKNADEFDMMEKLDFDERKMPKPIGDGGGEEDGWGMVGSFRKLTTD